MLIDFTDSTSLVIFGVAFVVALVVLSELFRGAKPKGSRFRRRATGDRRPDLRIVAKQGDDLLASASEQLRRVMSADFKPRKAKAEVDQEAVDKAEADLLQAKATANLHAVAIDEPPPYPTI